MKMRVRENRMKRKPVIPVARFALLVVMMTFFAVLALDISVPAVVLGLMALSNMLVLSSSGGQGERIA